MELLLKLGKRDRLLFRHLNHSQTNVCFYYTKHSFPFIVIPELTGEPYYKMPDSTKQADAVKQSLHADKRNSHQFGLPER